MRLATLKDAAYLKQSRQLESYCPSSAVPVDHLICIAQSIKDFLLLALVHNCSGNAIAQSRSTE